MILETALEDLISQNMVPVSGDFQPPKQGKFRKYQQVITSNSDVEMSEEPTPCPNKNRNRQPSGPSPEETDLEDDEHFRTPHTLKQKKIATDIIMFDSSELSGLSSEESEPKMKNKGKKTIEKIKDNKSKVTIINLDEFP